jgi:hypothetical protein
LKEGSPTARHKSSHGQKGRQQAKKDKPRECLFMSRNSTSDIESQTKGLLEPENGETLPRLNTIVRERL